MVIIIIIIIIIIIKIMSTAQPSTERLYIWSWNRAYDDAASTL